VNKELQEIEDYNRRKERRYMSVSVAVMVIWASFLWWLFGM